MGRITSSERRSALRGRGRSGTHALAESKSRAASKAKPMAAPAPEAPASPPPVRRKWVKAARAVLRARRQRSGFGKALRAEIRVANRASVQRAKKRLLGRRRLPAAR
ncbi:hypothetical protein [Blastomonas sp. SL216]|uniref:hypothetical protein n=1 Tax=Blastomonas sp. SL216 TaxID=2995169 RepID=UPI002377CD5D|nr:hypothetical protein OU999_13765 [Blastomonas sp. SL216]